jgi:hypothetical protein
MAFLAASAFGSLRNETAFLLGQGRIQVQHKRIGVPAEFGHDEGHTLRHQAGHKSHVTRKPVELGNNYATLRRLCSGQRCGQLRAQCQTQTLIGFTFPKVLGRAARSCCQAEYSKNADFLLAKDLGSWRDAGIGTRRH